MTMRVPYVDLIQQHASLRPEILRAVDRVLERGLFINGPEVEEFEKALATFLGIRHVIGVGSGTAALTLALRLKNIGPGDEVITVSHSYVATASAIRLVGASPVFVDVDPGTALLDPKNLGRALSKKTKAVLPVHLGGAPCDLDAIGAFCSENGLHLIEDCAQAIGAKYRGVSVGSRDLGCFSLHPLKVLSACGDAGFITTNSDHDAERLRVLRTIGHIDRDHVQVVSENGRLDTLHAAILLVKLPYLQRWIEARTAHATAYRDSLEGIVELTRLYEDTDPAFSAFVVRDGQRDDLIKVAAEQGFELKIHYPIPIHRQEAFRDFRNVPLPNTERLARTIVSLPVSPELQAADRDALIRLVREWKASGKKSRT